MKALIVAAGKGERINTSGEVKPKPLYFCGGQYLIGHVITRLRSAGITEIVIVVGFMGDLIQRALGDGSQFDVKIEYVNNSEFDKANGWSVFQARHLLSEPFILSMSDHVFEPAIVQQFVNFMSRNKGNYLCTDRKLNLISDMDDATKVREENGKIIRIHKKLEQFNTVDCGMFFLTPDFFRALVIRQKQGDFSITGGVQQLADEGSMKTYDLQNGLWVDVDTRRELAIAEEHLLLAAQKREHF